MRSLFNKLALLGLLCLFADPALGQSRIDQLGAAAAVGGTNKIPICQSCGSSTPAVGGTAAQFATYFNSLFSGDFTVASGGAGTLATVNGNVGNFTAANITVNAKGLVTAAANGSAGASLSANNAWTAGQAVTPSVLTDASTIAVDASLSNGFTVTLGGNRTLGNPTNTKVGQTMMFSFLQDGMGSRTLAYSSNFKFASGVAPVLSTAPGAEDAMSCWARTTSILICSMIQDVR